MRLAMNGEPVRAGDIRAMIFPAARLIACARRFVTPPPGIGMGKTPAPAGTPGTRHRDTRALDRQKLR